MAIRSDERKNYNRAVRDTNALVNRVEDNFLEAQETIDALIAAYIIKETTSPTTPGSALRISRTAKLNNAIKDVLKDLTVVNRRLVKSAYIREWNDSYLNTSYDIEKEVNLVTLPSQGADFDFDLDVGYRHINNEFIAGVYDAPVAGLTHTDRTTRDRIVTTAQVLSAVSFAIVPDLTIDEIRELMAAVSDAVEKGKNRAITDAQQQVTTANSLGVNDSIDTSVDNGIGGKNIWRAVLDGKTRPVHANEDGDARDESTGLFTLSNGHTIQQPRIIGRGTAGLGDIIRCRCHMLFLPDNAKPSPRSAKMEDGSWEEVNGDLDWEEWSKTIEGERAIEAELEYRKIRNRRLAVRRNSA